jgi:hypothetical protein
MQKNLMCWGKIIILLRVNLPAISSARICSCARESSNDTSGCGDQANSVIPSVSDEQISIGVAIQERRSIQSGGRCLEENLIIKGFMILKNLI